MGEFELRPPDRWLSRLLIHSPRGMFRWTAYVLAVTAFAAAIPTPLYPVYQARFGFSEGMLGLLFAAYTPGVFLTLFFVAPHAERIGRRKLLALGMALTAIAAGMFAVAGDVLVLALSRLVAGLAVGATTSVATAAMNSLEPYHDAHHVARVAVASNFGGFALGVFFSGLLVTFLPHETSLVYLLPLIASLLGVAAVYATPETASGFGAGTFGRVQRISVPAALRRPFWVAAGGIAACYSIYGLFAALVPSYVRSGLGFSTPWVAGAIVAVMFGSAAVIQLATSQIRDRRALLLGFPLLVATSLALVAILSIASVAWLILVAGALGVAVGLTFMGSVTLVDRVAPDSDRGEILAGFYCAGYLALAVPTVGIAELSERIGLSEAGILLGLVLAIGAVGLWAMTSRTPTPPGGGGRPRETVPSP